MNINYNVPFYSNTPDDTHCFQACLRMILKYFQPNKEFSWQELDRITAKKEGLWTWQFAAMLWMKNNGYEVVDVEVFDYKKFIEDGEKYLLDFYGEKAGKEQIKHSDVSQEIKYAKELLRSDLLITKDIPTVKTLKKLLEKKFLLICLVDRQTLNKKSGYVGHFVIVKGIEEDNLVIHDPGLPAVENRKVSFKDFERAWAVPDENAKVVIAFKPR